MQTGNTRKKKSACQSVAKFLGRVRVQINILVLHLISPFRARYYKDAGHNYFNVFLKSKNDIIYLIKNSIINKKILIIGCGYHYSDVVLFSDISNYVVGLDTIKAYYRDGFMKTYQSKRINEKDNILKAFFISFINTYITRKYFDELYKLSKISIDHSKYNLQCYDGYKMPFNDEFFDIAMSNAVIEHVNDIDMFFKELCRVTKKHGISYHLLHNFYSLSGSHVSERIYLKYPWGHLRGIYKTNNLNKLTPKKIKTVFSKYFNIISFYQVDKNHYKKGINNEFIYEGENLLSENLIEELRNYPKEMLLTRSYLIIGKKD